MLAHESRLRWTMDIDAWLQAAAIDDIEWVSVDALLAVRSVHLPGAAPSDSADRMIIALARHRGAPLLTADARIHAYRHVSTVW
jgi:PIN domain nuclease of toxin-antitoxin system